MKLSEFFDENGDCHCDTCCGNTDCEFCIARREPLPPYTEDTEGGPTPSTPAGPVLCTQCRIGPAEFGTLCDYCWELRERRKEQGDDPCPCCGPDTCTTCHGDGCRDCEPLEDDDYYPEPPTQAYPILWR